MFNKIESKHNYNNNNKLYECLLSPFIVFLFLLSFCLHLLLV